MAQKKSNLITHGRRLNDLGIALVESIYEAGGTDEDARRIFKNDMLREQFGLLVMRRIPFTRRTFSVWKTIKLGTGLETADDFRTAFKGGGYKINSDANNLLSQHAFAVMSMEFKVELVTISPPELGLRNGATRSTIYQRAQESGLRLCPFELALQLRLQYEEQLSKGGFLIAMEPVSNKKGYPEVFRVERDIKGLWLTTATGVPECNWHADSKWVFVNRK